MVWVGGLKEVGLGWKGFLSFTDEDIRRTIELFKITFSYHLGVPCLFVSFFAFPVREFLLAIDQAL